MERKLGVGVVGEAVSEAERSEAQDPAGVRRGRPGRRSVDERTGAIVELLSGKATVDQVAFRFGVHPKTVKKWREVALEVFEMSRQTSRGKATVVQMCEAFGVSREAYYRSRHRPPQAQGGSQRWSRQGSWASASELEAGIQWVIDGHPSWGVRKVWAYLRKEALIASRKKVELIWTRDCETIAELREAIPVWLKEYNHRRPHQALNWETPAERRARNLSPSVKLEA